MARRQQISEGRTKILYEGPEPGTLIQYFKDDAPAIGKRRRASIAGKGILCNCISEFLMLKLAEIGIPTHLVRRLNMREQLVREVEIIPFRVVVRNIAAGKLSERLGIREGTLLPRSIVEFYSKREELGRPLLAEEHITAFGWASVGELDEIMRLALRVNDFLTGLFFGLNISLVGFGLDFGRLYSDDAVQIVVADEISPDSCRLWDMRTGEKMGKGGLSADLGRAEDGVREVARRLGIMPEGGPGDFKPSAAMH